MSIGTIEELKTKKCQPCEGGVPPVPREEAERLLKDLPGWELTEDGKRIRREWTVKHFMAAMGFFNRFKHQLLGHFSSKTFDHQHRFLVTGNDQIQVAFLEFVSRWQNHPLIIDSPQSNRSNRALERQRRDVTSNGRSIHGQDVRIILPIARDNDALALHFIEESLGE